MLGRWILWQVAVYAPGTANSVTFLPLKISSVVLTCGPSAVITRNFASGSLSPTWMVIVNSPWTVRRFLKPDRQRAQYSAPRKQQWPRAFTVILSARKAARFQKRLLFGGRSAVQKPITMREAPEPANYVCICFGVFEVFRIAGPAEEFDAAKLVGQMLRMHERHVQGFQQRGTAPRIGAPVECPVCDFTGHRVA